jgi:DNA replication protein DnaC
MSDTLEHDLIALRLHYLAAGLNDFIARATKARHGPREIIAAIVRAELTDRQERTTARRLKESKIGRFKPLTEFDWSWPKRIDRDAVERLLTLDFMADNANVILAGPQGIGKTMIGKNVALAAVMAGQTALVTTASQLVIDLAQQDSSRSLQSRLRTYLRPDLLVIDEVGYLSFDSRAADVLFEVVSRRYESGSILMTTNLAFKDWPTIFPGATCVTAMIDRLTHHAEIIAIEGESYRCRESKERQTRRGKKTKTQESENAH